MGRIRNIRRSRSRTLSSVQDEGDDGMNGDGAKVNGHV